MIKFYRGDWADLSGRATNTTDYNSICFIQDRGVLYMGGKQYGKDVGVVKTMVGSNQMGGLSRDDKQPVASGTLYTFQGDQSLWLYQGDTSDGTSGKWARIMDPTLSSASVISQASVWDATEHTGNGVTEYTASATVAASGDMYQATVADVTKVADNIEGKISAAYGNQTAINSVTSGTNNVVVSKINGIAKSEFVLNQNRDLIAVTTDGTGVKNVSTNEASAILVTEKTLSEQTNDILANGLEIRKKASPEAGYRASYGLYNKQTGTQLGASINIIKDQFLRGAEYVAAYEAVDAQNKVTGYIDWPANAAEKPAGIPANTTRDSLNRFLKLTFALPATKKGEGTTSGIIEPDSSDVTYDTEADTTIYINVNELFDSYKGINGVRVDQDTNNIYGAVATDSETGDTGTGKRGTHYTQSFLTVGGLNGGVQSQDFKLNGIKQEITAYIQDISGISHHTNGVASTAITAPNTSYAADADYPTFLTEVGIGTNGVMTGAASGINAEGVKFNGKTGTDFTTAAGSVGAAISAISQHIDGLEYTYDGMNGADAVTKTGDGDTAFIYAISQKNGQIATSAMCIDAANLKANAFTTDLFSGTNASSNDNVTKGLHLVATDKRIFIGNADGTGQVHIQDALTSLAQSTHDAISAMDLTLVGVEAGNGNNGGTASNTVPSGNLATREAYKIINTIRQSDGKVFATDLELKPENIYFDPIAAVTGKGEDARVAVVGYNVEAALNSISNTIAKLDYIESEHDFSAGLAPAINTDNKLSITNTIGQTDGLITETKIDLTDANTFVGAINGNLPGVGSNTQATSIDARAARVAINSNSDSNIDNSTMEKLGGEGHNGSLAMALTNISNILADYLSFHNAAGAVI